MACLARDPPPLKPLIAAADSTAGCSAPPPPVSLSLVFSFLGFTFLGFTFLGFNFLGLGVGFTFLGFTFLGLGVGFTFLDFTFLGLGLGLGAMARLGRKHDFGGGCDGRWRLSGSS